MSAKQMKFDADARLSLLSGAEQIARAVAVTMGPTGRHVVLQKSFSTQMPPLKACQWHQLHQRNLAPQALKPTSTPRVKPCCDR